MESTAVSVLVALTEAGRPASGSWRRIAATQFEGHAKSSNVDCPPAMQNSRVNFPGGPTRPGGDPIWPAPPVSQLPAGAFWLAALVLWGPLLPDSLWYL